MGYCTPGINAPAPATQTPACKSPQHLHTPPLCRLLSGSCTPVPAFPQERGQRRLSANRPFSEQDCTSKETRTSLDLTFPPFLTTRSVLRSDGKGIWRDEPWRCNTGLRSHLASVRCKGHGLSELQNIKRPWNTPQTPKCQQQAHRNKSPTQPTLEPRHFGGINTLIPENIYRRGE